MAHQDLPTTDSFLAAAERAHDANSASEALQPFLPDPPCKEVDDAVLGPQSTGRTAELFSQSTPPLVPLVCFAAEIRGLYSQIDATSVISPLREVLSHPDLHANLLRMPRLVSQLAHAVAEKASLFPGLCAADILEHLYKVLSHEYQGVTNVHAPLLSELVRTSQIQKAEQVCRGTDITQSDFTLHLPRVLDFLEYLYLAGMIFLQIGAYDEALHMWDTAVSLPLEPAQAHQCASLKRVILLRLLRDGSIPSAETLFPFLDAVACSNYKRECNVYFQFAQVYGAYVLGSPNLLRDMVQNSKLEFEGDNTLDLVEQCLQARPKHAICSLARVYKTFPLNHLTVFLGLESHEATLYHLQELSADETIQYEVTKCDIPNDLHSIPVPDDVLFVDAGRELVHFTQPTFIAQAFNPSLALVLASETRSSALLKNNLKKTVLSQDVISRIISFSGGTTFATDNRDDDLMADT